MCKCYDIPEIENKYKELQEVVKMLLDVIECNIEQGITSTSKKEPVIPLQYITDEIVDVEVALGVNPNQQDVEKGVSRKDMIEFLIDNDINMLNDSNNRDLKEMFLNGVKGYNDLSDVEIAEEYNIRKELQDEE